MKVLVISSNGFSKTLNNGKTLESMFSAFKKEELCQIVTRPQNLIDFNYCNSIYCISQIQVIKCALTGRKSGYLLQPSNNESSSASFDKLLKVKRCIPNVLREYASNLTNWQNESFWDWLKAENPNLVFVVGGSTFLHSIAIIVSGKLKIPLTTFFTDDYIIYPKPKGFFGTYFRERLRKSYIQIIEKSARCFAIGDEMSREYNDYFGKCFLPIMNSLPPQQMIRNKIHKNQIVISYFGGIHLNRWRMLVRFSSLLPRNCVLNVYSAAKLNSKITKAFDESGIKFKGCVSGNLLRESMHESNILLHVESDDPTNRRLTKLSISTKIPEYLMSGRCIIGFGPIEVASMKEIQNNHVGYVIDSSMNDSEISAYIASILSKTPELELIGIKGYEFALKKYDGKKNAMFFRNQLESITK